MGNAKKPSRRPRSLVRVRLRGFECEVSMSAAVIAAVFTALVHILPLFWR
jgi:hypothetical protein